MRIAIVDDSDSFRFYLESLLREAGYEDIDSFPSAEVCLEAMAERPCRAADLVLMDLNMPGLGGLEGTRRLKADSRLKDIPVITVTVSDDDADLAEAFAAGAMDYLKKPPRLPELLARVASALRLKAEIDDRKAREGALRSEKEFVTAILEQSHDGIAVVGRDGRFAFLSPGMERIFGYPADAYATIEQWAALVFPDPDVKKDILDVWSQNCTQGHVWHRLHPFVDNNRQARFCQIHFAFMPSGEQILTVQDVTLFEKQKRELLIKHNRHQKDMEAAAEIQRSLLPRRFSMTDSLKFGWEFRPCENIGGDIFNVFPLGPNHVGLYMLDVSGHGVASSLVALSVYHFMHYQRSTLVNRTGDAIEVIPPNDVIARLDAEFPYHKFSKFFTMVYLTIDLRTGKVTYSNAGHPPPVRIGADGGVSLLPERGTIVGLEGFAPFPLAEATLAPGDKLLLVSDGLADLVDGTGQFFGERRCLDLLAAHGREPVSDILAAFGRAIADFTGPAAPRDDVSLLGVEFVRPKA